MNDCPKIRGNNGQLFNRCNRCNCDFFHSNVPLQLRRHCHARQVLTRDRKLPDAILSLPGAIDSRESVSKLSPTADESRTFGMYSCQNYNITKTTGTLLSSALQNWPICRILPPLAQKSQILFVTSLVFQLLMTMLRLSASHLHTAEGKQQHQLRAARF